MDCLLAYSTVNKKSNIGLVLGLDRVEVCDKHVSCWCSTDGVGKSGFESHSLTNFHNFFYTRIKNCTIQSVLLGCLYISNGRPYVSALFFSPFSFFFKFIFISTSPQKPDREPKPKLAKMTSLSRKEFRSNFSEICGSWKERHFITGCAVAPALL